MKKISVLRPAALIAFSLVYLLISGFVFINDPVELDPGKRRVYLSRTVQEIYRDAADPLPDSCYAVSGKIGSIGKKYDSFKLFSEDGKNVISCKTSAVDVKNMVALMDEGDRVTAYGVFEKDFFGSGLHGDILMLGEHSIKTGADVFCTGEDRIFDHTNTEKKEIVNPLRNGPDIISYRVPKEWVRTEQVLDDKGDHIYGFQYRLNALQKKSMPESLYVFYFDYNKNLADRSQYDMTDRIEKALVENILKVKDAGKCPEAEKKASYGVNYQYYDDKYEHGDDSYHTEFVFRKNGTRGLIAYLYIYRLPDHADEVMYLLRTTEVESNDKKVS